MQVRPFGPGGVRVGVVGQGTWNIEREPLAAIETLRRGLDRGMSHVDTAELYGGGRVEELVGRAIVGRRDEVFLVSKVLPENASRSGTVLACERSLARLGTDRLDCYLLHWRGPHPVGCTIAAFEQLREAGKIRAWGVSNFDERRLAEVVALAGAGRVACNQVLYHLGERSIEHAVLPFCAAHGIALVAYSPFGSKHFPSSRSAAGRVLAQLAAARGATPRQLALAFLVRHPAVFAIPKTVRPERAEENAAAADLELTAEDVERLEAAFPRGVRRRGVPTS